MDAERDYYAMLGVPQSATAEEIRRAYRAQARRYHPDSRREEVVTGMFREVHAAYAVLGDPQRRRAYDRRLAELGLGHKVALCWEIVVSKSQLSTVPGEQMLYLLVSVRPATITQGERLPLNLCLVVDRSTSMEGARLNLVKAAAHEIVDGMHEDDALAVVVFSDRAEVVLPSEVGVNRVIAKAKLSSIWAGGGTEILRGMRAGLAELQKHHDPRVISHMILLTDGQTYGDEEHCIAEARRAGARRIGITAMGIGEDWNDALLDEIAARSGGVSAYVASPGKVHSLLEQRVRSLGTVFAQGMMLLVRCPQDVRLESAHRVSPHLQHLLVTDGLIDLGGLQGDAPVVVVLELAIRRRTVGEHRIAQLELTADIPARGLSGQKLKRDITCMFKENELPPEPVPIDIVNALHKVTLCHMQEQTWAALESGDFGTAARKLEMVATRLLDLGEAQLARSAMLEAGRIAAGAPTAKGRKEIKYGTRGLALALRITPHG